MTCLCPTGPGRQISDPTRHAAWHQLVVAQGGPAGVVNAETLREARGLAGGTPVGPTFVDFRAEDTGKRVPGWRRRAAAYDG